MCTLTAAKVGGADQINTPGQWEQVAEIELSTGMHRIKLERPGPLLAPGDAWRGELGPVAVERVACGAPDHGFAVRAEADLCGRRWDWIELVGP